MKSFDELCQENYSKIYKYIFGMSGSKETTEDLIQEVFTVAYEKGEAFINHEKPLAFLYRTARNLTLTHLKRQKAYILEPLPDNISNNETDLYDKILMEQDMKIDETAYTQQVLSCLKTNQHELYKQRYIERKSIKEIANDQGISEIAIRMRLVRLRREVQGIVKKLKLGEN